MNIKKSEFEILVESVKNLSSEISNLHTENNELKKNLEMLNESMNLLLLNSVMDKMDSIENKSTIKEPKIQNTSIKASNNMYLRGSMNNWNGDLMTKNIINNEIVWSIDLNLPKGNYEFKFSSSNKNWNNAFGTLNGNNIFVKFLKQENFCRFEFNESTGVYSVYYLNKCITQDKAYKND